LAARLVADDAPLSTDQHDSRGECELEAKNDTLGTGLRADERHAGAR
jgi:hypothetical protein